MKILLVGLHSGWMGLHLSHFSEAFRKKNIEVIPADYHRMGRLGGFLKVPGEEERRNRALEKKIAQYHPDLILFAAQWSFDLVRLKSYFKGKIAVYDYDGPRRRNVEDYLPLMQNTDLFFTVSRWLQRKLAEQGKTALYLPHGVNTGYYAPQPTCRKFEAHLSYIGRATSRRIALCTPLAPYGLALYGARWHTSAECRKSVLSQCVRIKRDVKERELVDIYTSSNAVLNMLQENLNLYQTILSIQCFAIPSAAGCLLAEYVEELPEAFEPGKEVLCFQTPEELTMWAEKCCKEPAFARAVGEAGRRRCLAAHQWSFRVDEFLKYL